MAAFLLVIVLSLAALAVPLSQQARADVAAQESECLPQRDTGDASATSRAIDADVWLAVCAAVATDDIDALGRTYHPAAVLVTSQATVPIAQALARWKQAAAEARRRGTRATVAFRFSKRQDDAATAFETGIFRYATTDSAGVTRADYVPFEALFLRENGTWLMLMERQLEPTTQADWDALPH